MVLTGTASVGTFTKSLLLQTAKNLEKKASSYRLTRVNTIEAMTWEVSGY